MTYTCQASQNSGAFIMKEITLKVPENKLSFFMQLIKSLGFVAIPESDDKKDDILRNVDAGFKEMKKIKEGKLKTASTIDFLNEL
jgi:hypothetical protein